MSFYKIIQSIPNIKDGYKKGLQALGTYSVKVIPANARNCNGSIDLDDCLKKSEPQASRWDFVLGYEEKSYFVEVHSASGQVSKVIEKTMWLRSWLKNEGESLAKIHHEQKNFHWIPTNGVNIIGKERLRLAQEKVIIVSRLRLPQ